MCGKLYNCIHDKTIPQCISSKESAYNARDTGDMVSIPGSGRYPGEENGNPFQFSCLENDMDREAWWSTVHAVTKSWTPLSDYHFSLSFMINSLEFS